MQQAGLKGPHSQGEVGNLFRASPRGGHNNQVLASLTGPQVKALMALMQGMRG